MVYWTGLFWQCTKCGTVFIDRCPYCGASPENTEHDKVCLCKDCEFKRGAVPGGNGNKERTNRDG
jgi:hypothetical protein